MNDSLDLSIEPAAAWRLTPEQKDRLTDLLDGYLARLEQGLPPPREELLSANPDLAEALQSYFHSLDELHGMAGGFQRPTVDPHRESHGPIDDEKRLGDFRLLREIGRGGMGVVYEAEQISLGRRVALKVLPFAAVLDSRQIARFKHEAQAAGQLNHPNIVSVFAVGVERGVHYYAMQFIDGQPLDRVIAEMRQRALPESADRTRPYPPPELLIDVSHGGAKRESPAHAETKIAAVPAATTQHSALTAKPAGSGEYIRGAVRLGIEAAGALHAAHENGIIHRDIKPSNLLVDGNGKLWVTDFGLARRETDPTLTRTGDLVGTMRYMSPEQATGQMALVDHRTDIYSLAATLYELLTLEPAIVGQETQAMLRQIERHDPRPPRQLQPKISLDLQTVVMKGMAKRREDRYTTAHEFADDLQRILDGKPIVARPPTLLDRAARWTQRHREITVAAAVACLLLLVGLGVSTFLIARAEHKTAQNYALAEKRFRDAQDTVERLGLHVSDRLAKVPGAAEIRKDILRETLEKYRKFVAEANDHPELKADLGLIYSKIGKLSAEIGKNDDAIAADREAIRIYQDLAHANPDDVDSRERLGVCQNNLGRALARTGETAKARESFANAIQLLEEAQGRSDDSERCMADLAETHNNLGLLYRDLGDGESATAELDRAAALQEKLLAAAPEDPERLRDLAAAMENLGSLLAGSEPRRAIDYYQRAVALQKKAIALAPDNTIYCDDLATTYNNLGRMQARDGKPAAAAEAYNLAVEMKKQLVERAPADKTFRQTLAIGYNNLGLAQTNQGQPMVAEASFRRGLTLQEALVAQDPRDAEAQSLLGGMFNNLGLVLEDLRRPADALKTYESAVEHQKQAVALAGAVAKYRRDLSKHYFNYARVLRETGQGEEALRAALASRDARPMDPNHLFSVAEMLASMVKDFSSREKADPAAAAECAKDAVATLKRAKAAGWKPPPNSNWTRSFSNLKNRPDFIALTN